MTSACVLTVNNYRFNLCEAVAAARRVAHGRRVTVLLEAPPGLVRYLPLLAQRLRDLLEEYDVEVSTSIRLEPAFGSCDLGLAYAAALNAEMLVHVGHYPYPYLRVGSRSPHVVYVEAEYLGGDSSRIIGFVEELGARSIAILYTAQHRRLAREACNELARYGRACRTASVMGCYVIPVLARGLDGYDAVIVVAGGSFHVVSVGLSMLQVDERFHEKLYQYDPYEDRVRYVADTIKRILSWRYGVVMEALEARRYGIIVGVKPGQRRPWLVDLLVKLLERAGRSYDILVSERLVPSDIDNLAPDEYDAYVVTTCPYIPLDDLHAYRKPVLTPGEARMVLTGSLKPYRYPW